MIPPRPPNGCPEGTFDGATTCYCEDHCSWEVCRLLNPPLNCLLSMQGDAFWSWDLIRKSWVAQGIQEKD